ncbi:hypothetical protein NXF25_015753, partial [Crotalus adamanteus]
PLRQGSLGSPAARPPSGAPPLGQPRSPRLRTVSIASAAALRSPSPPSLPRPPTLRHCLFVLEKENKMSLEPPEGWGGEGDERRQEPGDPALLRGKDPTQAPRKREGVPQLESGRRGFPPRGGGRARRFQGGRRREKSSSLSSSDRGFLVQSRRGSFPPKSRGTPPQIQWSVYVGGEGLLIKEGLDPGDQMGEVVGFLVAVDGVFPLEVKKVHLCGCGCSCHDFGGYTETGVKNAMWNSRLGGAFPFFPVWGYRCKRLLKRPLVPCIFVFCFFRKAPPSPQIPG